jgi:hypothetical protein
MTSPISEPQSFDDCTYSSPLPQIDPQLLGPEELRELEASIESYSASNQALYKELGCLLGRDQSLTNKSTRPSKASSPLVWTSMTAEDLMLEGEYSTEVGAQGAVDHMNGYDGEVSHSARM